MMPRVAIRRVKLAILNEARVSVPPLVTQRALVPQIEGEQNLVQANRDLVQRFERKIQDTVSRVCGSEHPTLQQDGQR